MNINLKKKSTIVLILIVVVALFVGVFCTGSVETGFTGVVTTFGKVEDHTLEAGFHFKSPFQTIIPMDNREQKREFITMAFSRDIQEVDVKASINFNIEKKSAMNLFKEVGVNYYDVLITPRLIENLKSVFSSKSAEMLVTERESLAINTTHKLQEEMAPYGINIISVSVEDIDFTDAYTNAVEAKQVAEQNKLRVATEEATLTAQAEQEAERQKIIADTERYKSQQQADAKAYEISTKAEAEAEANKKVALSITPELIQYNYAQRWLGEYPSTLVTGQNDNITPVLPIASFAQEGNDN